MCKELDEELAEGKRLAVALVDHMRPMGGAAETTIPVSAVDADGGLCEWEVTVALKGAITDPEKPS